MAIAWCLTLLAWAGVAAGVLLGHARRFPAHLGAAGSGLLVGIALFWFLPEVAESIGPAGAAGAIASAGVVLFVLDRFLLHSGHPPRRGAIGPLLAATAVHSFLDGWSVPVLASQPLANVVGPLALALHKLPEGVALGWVTRKSSRSWGRALAAGASVEALTLAGAWFEPRVDHGGTLAFGPLWEAGVLAVIGGSFLFIGVHTLLPEWRRRGVLPLFAVVLAAAGAVALTRGGGG
jgi:zinc transporter ZupT